MLLIIYCILCYRYRLLYFGIIIFMNLYSDLELKNLKKIGAKKYIKILGN